MNKSNQALYGAHAIIEALKANKRKLVSIYTTRPEPKAFLRVKPYLPKSKNYLINYVDRAALAQIAQTTDHMGIVAWMSDFVYKKDFFKAATEPKLVLLDGVSDVRNLGGILRSAYCTDFSGVIILAKAGATITPAAVKSSAGLCEHLKIYMAKSASHALELLKQEKYNLYVSKLGGQNATTVSFTGPFCLVVGSEEKGVSKEFINQGTGVTLPQKANDISYNASVAAGILMFMMSYN